MSASDEERAGCLADAIVLAAGFLAVVAAGVWALRLFDGGQ